MGTWVETFWGHERDESRVHAAAAPAGRPAVPGPAAARRAGLNVTIGSKRNMVRDSAGYAVAQFLVRVVMIARTMLAARWLGPAAMGSWNALQLLMDYGTLAPLGTQQGLDQMVPRRIVDGEPVALARVKRAGFTNILLLSLLFWSSFGGWGARRRRITTYDDR